MEGLQGPKLSPGGWKIVLEVISTAAAFVTEQASKAAM